MNGSKDLTQTPDAIDACVPSTGNRWSEAAGRDRNFLLNVTSFSPMGEQSLVFDHLGNRIVVDFDERRLKTFTSGVLEPIDHPALEMVTLIYLGKIASFSRIGIDIVSCRDLKESHFFSGIHAFDLEALTRRYGKDPEGFAKASERLGGTPMQMADSAYRLLPFPRIPLYYLLWAGDEEFDAGFSVLFDRSIERVFQADAIWALVNLTSAALLRAA
jgi:hypothetical protein